jgi:hypothetical protein
LKARVSAVGAGFVRQEEDPPLAQRSLTWSSLTSSLNPRTISCGKRPVVLQNVASLLQRGIEMVSKDENTPGRQARAPTGAHSRAGVSGRSTSSRGRRPPSSNHGRPICQRLPRTGPAAPRCAPAGTVRATVPSWSRSQHEASCASNFDFSKI